MSSSIAESLRSSFMKGPRRAIEAAGTKSLNHLVLVAQDHSEKSAVVGLFLLGLYKGDEYPFDLHQLRKLDTLLFVDCINVLVMDFRPQVDAHERVHNGTAIYERLIGQLTAGSTRE